nr:cobyrinic acid a,c-diamide synthase [Actinomycetota bacterium]
AVPSRHLGLVPAAERAPEAVGVVERLGRAVAEACDLDALLALARTAGPVPAPSGADHAGGARVTPGRACHDSVIGAGAGAGGEPRPVVAVFGGPAFTFSYAETAELLTVAGAEVVVVDPLRDASLPPGTAGLVVGGGFPEVHADALSANASLRADVAALARSGAPVAAECAGLLYLCEELDGRSMCGVLPARGRMTPRLALGYRDAQPLSASWVGDAPVTGHEHHRTVVEPRAGAAPAWLLPDGPEGFVQDGVHASYLHLHWAGVDGLADRFVAAARTDARTAARTAEGALSCVS